MIATHHHRRVLSPPALSRGVLITASRAKTVVPAFLAIGVVSGLAETTQAADKIHNKMVQVLMAAAHCEHCGTPSDDPTGWETPDGAVTAYDLSIAIPGDFTPSEGDEDGWPVDRVLDFDYAMQLRFEDGGSEWLTGVGSTHVVGDTTWEQEALQFEIEVRSFDLSGDLASGETLLMRASPALRSTVVTPIEELDPVRFGNESVGELWIDLSFDGGTTWANVGQTVPEPSGCVVLSAAALLTVSRQRRNPHRHLSKYPPAEPEALKAGPLEAVDG